MKRKKMIILPQLNNCGGDIEKKWFVFFSVRNPKTDKLERHKVYGGLIKIKDASLRTNLANELIQEYAQKLRAGWTPYNDDEMVIYNDHLEYDHLTRIYGKKRMENKTIRFYASKFIDFKKSSIDNEGTLPTYQSKLRIFSNWIVANGFGDNDVTSIDNRIILDFFNWLIHDQKRSAKTVGDYRQILSGLFEWLVKERVFLCNPVHDLPKCVRINDQSPAPIQEMDIKIFKNELVKDPQLWLAVQFQYYCALRPGRELRLLKIKNIDFIRGLVTINRSEAKIRITRTVVIPAPFLLELRQNYQLHTYNKEYFVFGKEGNPGAEHLGKNNLRFRFNAIRKKLNMPLDYKFYSWKHTGGVRASLSGVPDKHIQMQMGHTNLETTAKYLRKMVGYESDFLRNKFPTI